MQILRNFAIQIFTQISHETKAVNDSTSELLMWANQTTMFAYSEKEALTSLQVLASLYLCVGLERKSIFVLRILVHDVASNR
ncbi:CLUMA_CG017923, isoform A [Clunio marinus]|uniref:CLUMA_CG017923, isoform A n=1 Tax=Clunio marinus TaxID=568069 RepID=A0A1J1J0D3_9DIPT|nr:CLUMA_CG017923, isoform A [Clunio marinus]